jgi:hypothetical protein
VKYRPEVISIFESPVFWAIFPLVWLAITPSVDDIIRGNGRPWLNVLEIWGAIALGFSILIAASNQRGPLYFPWWIPGAKITRWMSGSEAAEQKIEKKEMIALAKGSLEQIRELRGKHADKLSRKG